MSWAIAYSATVLALAYAVPKLVAVWWQASLVNHQIETMTTNASADQTQFENMPDFPGHYS